MKCTACKIEITDVKKHYNSKLHIENSRRKVDGIPPLSEDELFLLDITTATSNPTKTKKNSNSEENALKDFIFAKDECLFCGYVGDSLKTHLEEVHGYTGKYEDDLIVCIERYCVVCMKRFRTKDVLKLHMTSVSHINDFCIEPVTDKFVDDGARLYLDETRYAVNKKYLHYFRQNFTALAEREYSESVDQTLSVYKKDSGFNKYMHNNRVNQLKLSQKKNFQKHYTPDWMQ